MEAVQGAPGGQQCEHASTPSTKMVGEAGSSQVQHVVTDWAVPAGVPDPPAVCNSAPALYTSAHLLNRTCRHIRRVSPGLQ
jgi:hypothetical protein